MRGWFDAFREGGGPTLYESERTAASHDNILIAIYTSIGALFLVFLLVIVPAIRRNKIPTAVLMGASLYVLASILLGHFSTSWHVSSSDILTTYKHSAGLRLPGKIGVNIGLMYFNVTLQMSESNGTDNSNSHGRNRLFFNERFTWSEVDEVERQLQASLQRGYPSPIVSVAETLALDDGTFAWGRSYRIAGYYSDVILWTALALWMISNILFSLVPRFSGYFMLLTGAFLFLCDAIYAQLLPTPALTIRFEDTLLFFRYGWCFWMILTAGSSTLNLTR
ncbi:hypothetical protein RvY_11066-2 [Ramazzottius varieornatus]|uniref:Dual oxidase maturation factor 1 n=1 Tax=Ramazzottius varieornatus TaxID=947166 RepID=A0A1D1VEW5_RAMVA|nr:hypothetical protein RvY_11066-2 [Ramazzottius varieornatus]